MKCASAMAGMAEGALRLFHLGSHGVQVVADRDHGEQQNKYAAESAQEDERVRCRTSCWNTPTGRSSPSPPQQISGRQQGEPTEIKKKLHTKCPGVWSIHDDPNPVQLPQDNQDSTETASDLRTCLVPARGGQRPLRSLRYLQRLRCLESLAKDGFPGEDFSNGIGVDHVGAVG